MYARVENGQVVIYRTLPKQWIFTTTANQLTNEQGELYTPFTAGSSTGNFDVLPEWMHKAEGFLPLTIVNDSFDPEMYTRDDGVYEIGTDEITLTYTLTPLSTEELDLRNAAKLTNIKEIRQREITQLRDQKVLSGFEHNGVRYDTKEDSLRNINGMMNRVQATGEFPTGFPGWIAENNTITVMTIEEFKAFAIAACDHVATLYAVARAHKDAVDALTTYEDVQAYDIAAGW
jgi:hypothetical protein